MKHIILVVSLVLVLFAEDTYGLKKLDNEKTKSSMHKWLDNDLSLKPYRTNYLLLYGYASEEYKSNIGV